MPLEVGKPESGAQLLLHGILPALLPSPSTCSPEGHSTVRPGHQSHASFP